MSLFHPVNLVCPACGAVIVMQAVGSVNADRRPDLTFRASTRWEPGSGDAAQTRS